MQTLLAPKKLRLAGRVTGTVPGAWL